MLVMVGNKQCRKLLEREETRHTLFHYLVNDLYLPADGGRPDLLCTEWREVQSLPVEGTRGQGSAMFGREPPSGLSALDTYCTVLFCSVVYCSVLYCSVLYSWIQYSPGRSPTNWCPCLVKRPL